MTQFGLILLNGSSPGAGLTIDTSWEEVTLGRDAARDLPLDDNHCSRLHARIWWDSRQWMVEDCGSSNGTFVNSQRVDRAALRPGDVLRVGESLIVFAREQESQAPQWQARRIASSTVMMRVADPEKQPPFVSSLLDDESGLVRSAAVLCRLAEDLYQLDTRDEIIRAISDAICTSTEADMVAIWLADGDGRLAAVGGQNLDVDTEAVPVFASLALENNEAMLVQNGRGRSSYEPDDTSLPGHAETVISVPIPGRTERYGAIECGRFAAGGMLSQDDLRVVIAIAHQAGLALENFAHRERLEHANC